MWSCPSPGAPTVCFLLSLRSVVKLPELRGLPSPPCLTQTPSLASFTISSLGFFFFFSTVFSVTYVYYTQCVFTYFLSPLLLRKTGHVKRFSPESSIFDERYETSGLGGPQGVIPYMDMSYRNTKDKRQS